MNQPAYVPTTCPRCGSGAWGLTTHAVPCQRCGTSIGPVSHAAPAAMHVPPAQAQMHAPQMHAPQMHAPQMHTPQMHAPQMYAQAAAGAQPQAAGAHAHAPAQPQGIRVGGINIPLAAGGISKTKVIGGIVLAIALAIGGFVVKSKLGRTAKGNLSYASLGVDAKKPDGDTLIAALDKPAKKWKKDAIWWSANFQAVDAEGRVDVSKGAEVVYISQQGVQSQARSVRKDSIKKYGAGAAGVSHNKLWGATEPWKGIERHPTPVCKLRDVMAIVGRTLPPGKTVRVTFDPKFADFYAWRVMSDELKIDTLYSFSDCAVIK